jgi:hypothetical protein
MIARRIVLGSVLLLCARGVVLAQVDSNIAVTNYAQNHGQSPGHCTSPPTTGCETDADCATPPCVLGATGVACPSPGGLGCGGCYPAPIPYGDPTSELFKVNPEWSSIGDMIPVPSPGADASTPPLSQPVRFEGTVDLSKINVGGDFPGSHVSDDQNTFITPDAAFSGFIASGNGGSSSCPGEGCDQVEMELETGKYPLFAWAGEGDHVAALGRWIFDCGHPDPFPLGNCSLNAAQSCITDASDCAPTCFSGHCSNHPSTACVGSNTAPCPNYGTCTNPAPVFQYRAEMHPPQAIAVVRDKGTTPGIVATQADVYISADDGGAGDRCTDTHLATSSGVLFSKACFLNHCSVTVNRSCQVDKDCAGGETCVTFDSTTDPTQRISTSLSNFEFDMPLSLPPVGPTPSLKISTKSYKPKGGQMPKPTFQVTIGPTPNLHVIVPMATPLPNGKMPDVFAEHITAKWKGDAKSLTHVQVKFKSITINNPLKAATPAFPRQCTNANGFGLSGTTCSVDDDCPAGTCALNFSKACHTDKDCPKKDSCAGPSHCVGGITPGWNMFGQTNGDWVAFKKLTTVGEAEPFLGPPPYAVPSPTPLIIPEKFTFNEYVPSGGTVHIATTGQSFNCLDILYRTNLKDDLNQYGLGLGGACLAAGDLDPGRIDITHTGPSFTTAPAGVTCVAGATASAPVTCTAPSTAGDGGTCSGDATRLCVVDADCVNPQTCDQGMSAFTLTYTIQVK